MGELWRGHELTYCPHFSTFVNGSRWLDEELPQPTPPPQDRQQAGYSLEDEDPILAAPRRESR
jgi:hypothetical protein